MTTDARKVEENNQKRSYRHLRKTTVAVSTGCSSSTRALKNKEQALHEHDRNICCTATPR